MKFLRLCTLSICTALLLSGCRADAFDPALNATAPVLSIEPSIEYYPAASEPAPSESFEPEPTETDEVAPTPTPRKASPAITPAKSPTKSVRPVTTPTRPTQATASPRRTASKPTQPVAPTKQRASAKKP